MHPSFQVSCVIPFYNEGERVLSVLQVLREIPEICEIVCIDDGSKDRISKVIRERWPEIKLVVLPYNQGKSSAIKKGLDVVESDYILLMDADLRFLDVDEIKQAIAIVGKQFEIDMLILRRVMAPWFFKIDRRDVLFSGERILRKKALQAVLQQEVSGYQLEIAINQYMIAQRKSVRWMPWSASNTHKVKKWGWAHGVHKEICMFREMMRYAGLGEYIRQILIFARKQAETNEAS